MTETDPRVAALTEIIGDAAAGLSALDYAHGKLPAAAAARIVEWIDAGHLADLTPEPAPPVSVECPVCHALAAEGERPCGHDAEPVRLDRLITAWCPDCGYSHRRDDRHPGPLLERHEHEGGPGMPCMRVLGRVGPTYRCHQPPDDPIHRAEELSPAQAAALAACDGHAVSGATWNDAVHLELRQLGLIEGGMAAGYIAATRKGLAWLVANPQHPAAT